MQILILFIAFASTASLASADELKNYLFDMGAADSKVASGYIRVTPDDVYTAKRGYGFTSRVSGAVEVAEAFSRFGALLTDGVGGRYGRRDYAREGLVFRVDVPAGYYMAEVGVPDGPDARSLQVYVNGVFATRTRDNPMRQRGWDQTPPALLRFPVSVSGDSVLIRVEGVGSGKLYESQRVGLMSVALRPGYPHLFQRVGGRLEAVDPVFALEPDLQQGIARYDRGDFEGAASAFRKADVAPLVKAELLLWTAGHVSCPNHRALIEEALGLLKKDTADVRTQNRVRDIFNYLEGLDRVEARNWSWAREKFGMGQSSRLWYAQVHLRLVAGDPGDPLRFRALYALGQVYFGYFMELHDVRFVEASDEIFLELREAFLEDQMIRMYLGERFTYDDPKYTEGAEDAPIWATKQREALKRLLDVIHYWTDERQAENGEMGGHYEDDCEMFRHWQPALFAADDARAIRAIRRMADGVWDSDLIADGYSKRAYDVEHSSELISDTHPILLAAEALSVLVYNFEAGERTVGMRLWRLRDGVYSVVGKMGQVDVFRRDGVRVRRGTEVEVNLPSRQLTRISIDLTGEVQEMAEYLPDAGISARDVVVDGDHVRVTVHNIGTVEVENLTVALYDGEKALGRRVIQNLEAPLDLLSRTKQVAFSISSDMPDAVTVVLDPEKKLEEITRVNNRVTVNVK